MSRTAGRMGWHFFDGDDRPRYKLFGEWGRGEMVTGRESEVPVRRPSEPALLGMSLRETKDERFVRPLFVDGDSLQDADDIRSRGESHRNLL